MRQFLKSLGKLLLLALIPTLGLQSIRFLAGADFDGRIFLQIEFFISLVLLFAGLCQPGIDQEGLLQFHSRAGLLISFILIVALYHWLMGNTFSAWLLLGSFFALLLGWVKALGARLPLWRKALLEGIFLSLAGLTPALLNQFETRFSTEEFFVAFEVVGLMVFWLLLRGAFLLWTRGKQQYIQLAKWKIRRGWLFAIIGLLGFCGFIFTVQSYQHSFFPSEAPSFPGISAESPFICGEVPASNEIYQGDDVFQNLLEKVRVNPNKKAPEFAFLALSTQDLKWAAQFRESILSEAEAGLFTEPVGSVKYGQYLASQRAYFYPLVRAGFPGLFTPSDEKIILHWFSAINQRAFTVEWVDWMYAMAFGYWPKGPYENQENGAGLISLLELNKLAAPDLSAKNQQYLTENPRGWLTAFRVTDDAAVYQPEWIENAWFQSLYLGESHTTNQELSFEWLKVLALPDGSPLRYNHTGAVQYTNSAYWGASLLGDKNLLWLAGQALEKLDKNQSGVIAQPGAEQTLTFTGSSPTLGSCLVYANSGLPTQQGPLAPDKIVFRSGWEPNDIYMLLNLRFSGWHRYKATNALMQIYQEEPLIIENTSGENFDWLPTGRSIFRDKRIPRENLNGLQIAKTGLAAVLYQFTGIGGPWAQDPPYYAEVTHFETTPERTVSSTLIRDWHGWDHQRTIYFYPEGVVAVIDNAWGLENVPAALTWHLVGDTLSEENRIHLGTSNETGKFPEIVLLPINSNHTKFEITNLDENNQILRVQYSAPNGEIIQAGTIFLFNDWIEAQVEPNDQVVIISQGEAQIEIKLSEVFDE